MTASKAKLVKTKALSQSRLFFSPERHGDTEICPKRNISVSLCLVVKNLPRFAQGGRLGSLPYQRPKRR